MHIVYLKPHDGNNPGDERYTEVTLARRLCERGVAIPYSTWQKQQVERAALVMAAKEKEKIRAEAIAKAKAKAEVEEKKEADAKAKPKTRAKRKPVKKT